MKKSQNELPVDFVLRRNIYILRCLEILLFSGLINKRRDLAYRSAINYIYTLFVKIQKEFKLLYDNNYDISHKYSVDFDNILIKETFFKKIGFKEIDLDKKMNVTELKILLQAFMFVLCSINAERKFINNTNNKASRNFFRKEFRKIEKKYNLFDKKLLINRDREYFVRNFKKDPC